MDSKDVWNLFEANTWSCFVQSFKELKYAASAFTSSVHLSAVGFSLFSGPLTGTDSLYKDLFYSLQPIVISGAHTSRRMSRKTQRKKERYRENLRVDIHMLREREQTGEGKWGEVSCN